MKFIAVKELDTKYLIVNCVQFCGAFRDDVISPEKRFSYLISAIKALDILKFNVSKKSGDERIKENEEYYSQFRADMKQYFLVDIHCEDYYVKERELYEKYDVLYFDFNSIWKSSQVLEVEKSREKELKDFVYQMINRISVLKSTHEKYKTRGFNNLASSILKDEEEIFQIDDKVFFEQFEQYLKPGVKYFEHQKKLLAKYFNTRISTKISSYSLNNPYSNDKNYSMAMFWEPRVGKTMPTIGILINRLMKSENYSGHKSNVSLVVAPLRTIKTAWEDTFAEFYDVPEIQVINCTGFSVEEFVNVLLSAEKIAEKINKKIILLVNYEKLGRINAEFVKNNLANIQLNTLVLDESHKIKDPKTNVHKNIFKMFKNNNCKIILTGTPFGNTFEDVFYQLQLLYKVPFGCETIGEFCMLFGSFNYRTKKYELRSVSEFMDKLRTYANCLRQEDVGIIMPRVIQKNIQLSAENREKYAKIALSAINSVFVEDENGKTVEIDTKGVLALITKLRQTSSGFYLLNGETVQLGEFEKWMYVYSLLEETTEKTIVVCTFKEEYNIVQKICKELNKTCKFLTGDDFNIEETNFDVIVANPKAASLGLDLSECRLLIYPSYTYSMIEDKQMQNRVVNINSEEPAQIIYVYHANTIDMIIRDRIEGKHKNLKEIMEGGKAGMVKLAGLTENDFQ